MTRFLVCVALFAIIGTIAGHFVADDAKQKYENDTLRYERQMRQYPGEVKEWEAEVERLKNERISGGYHSRRPGKPESPHIETYRDVTLPRLIGLGSGVGAGVLVSLLWVTIPKLPRFTQAIWSRFKNRKNRA